MYFLTKIILVLSVIFYLMDQASSLNCYDCYSVAGDGDQDCFDNPKNFPGACPEYVERSTALPAVIGLSAAYSAVSNTRKPFIRIYLDECWKIVGTHIPTSKDAVHRACGSKQLRDNSVEITMKKGVPIPAKNIIMKMNVTAIHRCDSNLCNSSEVLNVGFFYSIFPLFFVCSINF